MKLIGLIIFILILIFKINFRELFLVITGIKWGYLSAALGISLIGLVVTPYRWYYVLKKLSIYYSFREVFKLYFLTMLLGTITPSRVGEIVAKIGFLKRKGYQISKSLVSIIIDRLADLFFLLLFSAIGLLVFSQFLGIETFFAIAIPLTLIALFLILSRKKFFKNLLEKLFIFLVPKRFKSNWQIYLKDFLESLQRFGTKEYLLIFLLTTCTWTIIFISMNFLALGWDIKTIPFFYLAISIALSRLVSLLPISISGLGTREASLLGLFSFFNIPAEKTIAFSLSMFLISIIINSLIGIYAWLKKF